jgi:flagellin
VASLTAASGFSVFVSNNGANGVVSGTISAVTLTTLTLNAQVITTQALAASAVTAVQSAVGVLGAAQGTVGTLQNRLAFAIHLAQSQSVNTQAAESRIRDANIAEESAALTKFSILSQSGIASLAQANASSGAVLALLR